MSKINKRSPKWYGWQPDLPDHRDLLYSAIAPKPPILPQKIDLQARCSPVENQGNLGSCTANALVGALEFLEIKDRASFVDLSRLFVYYNERAIEGTVDQDSGANIRDGVKSLAKQGVCPEKEWPYRIAAFAKRPSIACYKDAKKHEITSYHRIMTTDEMRTCLADGFPFVFGFTVYTAFESPAVAKSGMLNMPGKNEKVLGGHAVMCVGYDDTQQRFLVRNSWGADWGKQGYFTMPYAYLGDRNLSDDFWTIRVLTEKTVSESRRGPGHTGAHMGPQRYSDTTFGSGKGGTGHVGPSVPRGSGNVGPMRFGR
ncbi:MAG TPA: C1 family peptidase [Chthoniobacterales bacterium]|nr:C1 family peptidase [Chthoniobacterales bacterium]